MTQTRLLHLICRRYRIRTAHLSDAELSPQRFTPPVCFTLEDQLPSLDTSGLVFFGTSEEEIAVDETGSQACFRGTRPGVDSPRRACFRFFNEWFLKGHHQPSSCQRPAQFMPEVQEELTKAWRAPYSACMNPSTAAALTTVDGAEKKRYCKLSPHVMLDAGP